MRTGKKRVASSLLAELRRIVGETNALVEAEEIMLTGEHGIGVSRRGYLAMSLDPVQIGLTRGIKAAFDPRQILNPGKILPAA